MRTPESQETMRTELSKIAWLSAQDPHRTFHSLMHHINVESLRGCFNRLDGRKALGVDRISKEEYGRNLEDNLEKLIARMKRMAYRPQPVREVLIPKEGKAGATRPLGISAFEDKLIQKRMQELLESYLRASTSRYFWTAPTDSGPKEAVMMRSKHLGRI